LILFLVSFGAQGRHVIMQSSCIYKSNIVGASGVALTKDAIMSVPTDCKSPDILPVDEEENGQGIGPRRSARRGKKRTRVYQDDENDEEEEEEEEEEKEKEQHEDHDEYGDDDDEKEGQEKCSDGQQVFQLSGPDLEALETQSILLVGCVLFLFLCFFPFLFSHFFL
jgi:hypothetical protein